MLIEMETEKDGHRYEQGNKKFFTSLLNFQGEPIKKLFLKDVDQLGRDVGEQKPQRMFFKLLYLQ